MGNQSTQDNCLDAFCVHLFEQWENKLKKQKKGNTD